jgi:hypothetical protein
MGLIEKSLIDFAKAIWADWLTRMSGPISVPAAVASLWVSNDLAKTLLGITAIICFVVTCYRVWKPQRDQVEELEKNLVPKVDATIDSNVDFTRGNKGIRTVRLKIINISQGTVKNCRVREIQFVNKSGAAANMRRTFRLAEERFADMSKHAYQQTFDLQGYGSSELVEIAQLDETAPDKWVLMLYATIPTAPTLNYISREAFPHQLTVSITADNMAVSMERTFDLKISNEGTLEMIEV